MKQRELLGLVAAFAVLGLAQQPATITPRSPTTLGTEAPVARASIRSDTTLVLIPVSVSDRANKFVMGLDRTKFRLLEEGVEQEISQFSSEDVPVSVGIVFDTSGSMGSKLNASRRAVADLIEKAGPEDEFFLIEFNKQAELTVPFTKETSEIVSKLLFRKTEGRTALLDAVYLGIHEMKKASNPRKALVVITDGVDNASRYSVTEVRNMVRETDVQIYALGIFARLAARGTATLARLANETGGRYFSVIDLGRLPQIADQIGMELRNQYLLGYVPKNQAQDGKYRRVEVKLTGTVPSRLTVAHRRGYAVPAR